MNRFEQKKHSAFIVLLFTSTCSLIIGTGFPMVKLTDLKGDLLFLGFLLVINFLLIRWMNQKWFSMTKAFYKVDPEWRLYNRRKRDLDNAITSLRKNPTLIDEKMGKYGYSDPELFTTHLLQEAELAKQKEAELAILLEEIKSTPQKTLFQYAKVYFGM